MRTSRIRTWTVSGLVPVLLTAATALAPAARAATGPTFTRASCGDTSFLATCTFTWSGGTSPFTLNWTDVKGLSSSGGSGTVAGDSASVSANCIPQSFYEVKMTVTDAAGSSATTFAGGTCD